MLQKDIRSADKSLRDMKGTVDHVVKNREKFSQISNAELQQRKSFCENMSFSVQELKSGMDSIAVRKKIDDDEGKARARQQLSKPKSRTEADNNDFVRNQRLVTHETIQQQDVALESLGGAVDRLGDMGRGINEELREQNKMLDDLDGDLDTAGSKMDMLMAKLSKLLKTKDGCQIWCIVILTLILCILVALVIWV